jgi:hypothetical protein
MGRPSKGISCVPLRSIDLEHYAVEDQRFLGEDGFGAEVSREAGAKDERKQRKRPIEEAFKEIARRLEIAPAQGGFGTAGEGRSRTGYRSRGQGK